MRIINSFLIASVLIVSSSCALNKIFLAPHELSQDSSFNRYVEEYNDTLSLSFNEDKSPKIVDSKNKEIDLPYTIESLFFPNRNGTNLNAWLMGPKDEFNGTMIYFLHGNAGNIAYQFALATPFVERGYKVFMIDYSGFGFSEGKAKRKNVIIDANDGLKYLLERDDIDYERLLIYGQSLGGHLSAVVATQNQEHIDGVIIEGAFSSHKDIANEQVPLLGRLFTREMYSAKKNIGLCKKPVLIIHSTEDTRIPYHHGEVLYEAANAPKSMYTIDKPHVRGPLFYADSISLRMEQMISIQ